VFFRRDRGTRRIEYAYRAAITPSASNDATPIYEGAFMTIRKANVGDLARCLEIYAIARAYMRENGNPDQWGTTYPPRRLLEEDIAAERLYIIEETDTVEGVFLLAMGPDETYLEIEGAWLNDAPYAVIHRIASSGRAKGVVRAAVEFALTVADNVRIDTHANNRTMQNALARLGFCHCGTIYVGTSWEGRSPRMAYHLCK
jgi:hypothetical protein